MKTMKTVFFIADTTTKQVQRSIRRVPLENPLTTPILELWSAFRALTNTGRSTLGLCEGK